MRPSFVLKLGAIVAASIYVWIRWNPLAAVTVVIGALLLITWREYVAENRADERNRFLK